MRALAPLGKGVRREIRPHPLVHRLPGGAAVLGAEHPCRGYPDPHPPAGAGIDDDAVEAKSAEAGLPLRAGGMAGKAGDLPPVGPAVLRLEEGRRLDTGVEHTGFRCGSGFNVPQPFHGGAAISREPRLSGRRNPGGTQVVAVLQLGAPDGVISGGQDAAPVAAVVAQVENLGSRVLQGADLPVPPPGVAGEDEGTFAGSHQQNQIARAGGQTWSHSFSFLSRSGFASRMFEFIPNYTTAWAIRRKSYRGGRSRGLPILSTPAAQLPSFPP